jgi:hypothetical protein
MTSKSSFNLKLHLTISCKWALVFIYLQSTEHYTINFGLCVALITRVITVNIELLVNSVTYCWKYSTECMFALCRRIAGEARRGTRYEKYLDRFTHTDLARMRSTHKKKYITYEFIIKHDKRPYNRYTYEIILCGCYGCASNPHAWANPRDTKTAPK